jgi:peptide/nickel transport system substrate-binding protein
MAAINGLSRRSFLRASIGAFGLGLLAACAPQPPAAKPAESGPAKPAAPAPAATTPPAPAAEAKPAAQAATTAPAAKPAAEAKPAAPAKPAAAAKPDDQIGKHLIGQLEGPEIVTDASAWPKSFKEAPTLTELVKAGKLPPVEQRITQDPLVIKPVKEIGKYGGTWRRAFTGPADWSSGVRVGGTDREIGWDYTGTKLVPNIVRGWEVSPDGKTTTLLLRRGMKWSDGHPFTADDYMFFFEDMYSNKALTPTPAPQLITKSGHGVMEKVDESTVRYVFKDPYYAFPLILAGVSPLGGQAHEGLMARGGHAPAHYLKQFHPKYVGQEALDKMVKDAGFDNWVNLFKSKSAWALNPDLPVVTAWKTTTPNNTPLWTLERNPYSIWVDTEGNQLPYIDKITLTVGENLEVINLRAVAGEYDSQERHIDMSKIPVLLENQQKGNYKVFLDPGGIGADIILMLNQSYDADPEVAKWLQNVEFRRALSLGIDRDQLNETFWLGLGVPGSHAPWEQSPYSPGPEWRTKWSTLDLKAANELLDKVGLDKKDAEGFRLRTDGQGRLRLAVDTYLGFVPFTGVCEMIREQWKKIGIQADVKEHERNLSITRKTSNEVPIGVDVHWGTENMFSHSMTSLFPFDPTSQLGPLYGTWYASGGAQGKEPPEKIKEVMRLFREAFSAPEKEHYEMGKQIWRIALDELWGIGTVGQSPGVMGVRVVKSSMGNQPGRIFNGSSTLSPAQARPETYFFKS